MHGRKARGSLLDANDHTPARNSACSIRSTAFVTRQRLLINQVTSSPSKSTSEDTPESKMPSVVEKKQDCGTSPVVTSCATWPGCKSYSWRLTFWPGRKELVSMANYKKPNQ